MVFSISLLDLIVSCLHPIPPPGLCQTRLGLLETSWDFPVYIIQSVLLLPEKLSHGLFCLKTTKSIVGRIIPRERGGPFFVRATPGHTPKVFLHGVSQGVPRVWPRIYCFRTALGSDSLPLYKYTLLNIFSLNICTFVSLLS